MEKKETKSGSNGAGEKAQHALRKRVRAEIARDGLSQAVAAGQIGISDAALSQWLRGVYRGRSAGIADKCRRWLETRTERRAMRAGVPEPPAWAPTPLAQRALAALAHAQLAGDLVAAYGMPGSGKTVACERYAGARPSVWMVTATEATSSVSACLGSVCDAMGLRPESRWARVTEAAAAERMRDSGGLLIVDEAQCLPVRTLEQLRSLHDASGCGVALVGSDRLWLRLSGGRHPRLAQLFSRVGKRTRLPAPGPRDVAALLDAWGLEGSGLAPAAMRIARRPGGLRGVTKALSSAHALAAGRAVTGLHLRAAWRDLTGEVLPGPKKTSNSRKEKKAK